MEHVEREVGHAGGEAEARGGAGGAGEVRLAAAVAAPAQGASQQRRCCEEEEGQHHTGETESKRSSNTTNSWRGDVRRANRFVCTQEGVITQLPLLGGSLGTCCPGGVEDGGWDPSAGWAPAGVSSSPRLEEKTRSREGSLSIHSTLDMGRQLKRIWEGCRHETGTDINVLMQSYKVRIYFSIKEGLEYNIRTYLVCIFLNIFLFQKNMKTRLQVYVFLRTGKQL